ncbi:MAG: glycosyltransferase family 2 protein [Actinomycetales bacterium]|uniref:Glycosyltransferase family 2 protein n=1 Tax=Candidatus Phosphoribacter hodrii TaxID=2953743 RepID=A0A934X6K9_9MICO|nr:glycosyltransferase family 2 protein [Candidatus Phosphoribacter hodrii]
MSLRRVDVILASNRGGPFLDEAIDTALDQEGVSTRVILVDDGSPDPEFMERAAARREGVDLVRQPPQGVSVARNTGLDRVQADLVAFLDDDDIWEPTLLTLKGGPNRGPPGASAPIPVATTSTRQGTTSAKGGRQHRRGGRTCCAAPFRSPRSSRCFSRRRRAGRWVVSTLVSTSGRTTTSSSASCNAGRWSASTCNWSATAATSTTPPTATPGSGRPHPTD